MPKSHFRTDQSDDGWNWYSSADTPLGRGEPSPEKTNENAPAVVFREMAVILLIVLGVAVGINVGLHALGLS